MLMRSKLFVPGARPELFEKAVASAADAVSFDLEDAVAPAKKAEARAAVAAFLAQPPRGRKINVVRVNAVGSDLFAADMDAIFSPHLDIVNLPMVEDVSAIHEAARLLERREAPDIAARVRLLVNIETPKGLRKAHELAAAHPRVIGLQIGYADLFEPFGLDRRDQMALSQVRLAVRLAAAEAGIAAFDGAFAAVSDADGYKAECLAARRQGFAGKSCIHPSQIAAANAAFLPDAREIERAKRLVAAAVEAEAKGVAAFIFDGQMVDKPFIAAARAVIALADMAASREC